MNDKIEAFRMAVEKLIGYAALHGRDKTAANPDAHGDRVRAAHKALRDLVEPALSASPEVKPTGERQRRCSHPNWCECDSSCAPSTKEGP